MAGEDGRGVMKEPEDHADYLLKIRDHEIIELASNKEIETFDGMGQVLSHKSITIELAALESQLTALIAAVKEAKEIIKLVYKERYYMSRLLQEKCESWLAKIGGE
jgi:hypothetical protein